MEEKEKHRASARRATRRPCPATTASRGSRIWEKGTNRRWQELQRRSHGAIRTSKPNHIVVAAGWEKQRNRYRGGGRADGATLRAGTGAALVSSARRARAPLLLCGEEEMSSRGMGRARARAAAGARKTATVRAQRRGDGWRPPCTGHWQLRHAHAR
jgi:hypothetical protein